MRRGALIAAVLGIALLCAPSASAEVVFGSDGCSESRYKAAFIALTCGDGKVRFETREWVSWGEREAVAVGVLAHPDKTAPGKCQQIIIACPYVKSEATATFSKPARCPSNGRLQFLRLRIDAPADSDPELRQIERDFSCSQYAPERPTITRLGSGEATRLMRNALARKPSLSFQAGYARRVKCNKRVSRDRVRCKMSWNVGDLSFDGKGVIWFTYKGGDTYWNYAYRIRKRNHYCLATGGSNCVETIVVL
jgi:hypothetical protein